MDERNQMTLASKYDLDEMGYEILSADDKSGEYLRSLRDDFWCEFSVKNLESLYSREEKCSDFIYSCMRKWLRTSKAGRNYLAGRGMA